MHQTAASAKLPQAPNMPEVERLCLWRLFPISEDVMSPWCSWDSYRAEGGGRAPLGGHRAVPSRRAESAGGPGPTAQP